MGEIISHECEVCGKMVTSAVADLKECQPIADSEGTLWKTHGVVGVHHYCAEHWRPGTVTNEDGAVEANEPPSLGRDLLAAMSVGPEAIVLSRIVFGPSNIEDRSTIEAHFLVTNEQAMAARKWAWGNFAPKPVAPEEGSPTVVADEPTTITGRS